jgi:hypothetical protein
LDYPFVRHTQTKSKDNGKSLIFERQVKAKNQARAEELMQEGLSIVLKSEKLSTLK